MTQRPITQRPMTQRKQSLFEQHSNRPHSGTVWQNWAGNVRAHPRQLLKPRSEAEVQAIVRQAAQNNQKVRVVGAGHSFTDTAASDDLMLSLDELTGLEHHDQTTGHVTVWAGTRLYDLNGILAGLGRAQENMGDINRQSLAGAVSTGTHGTGLTLGSIGTQIEALRLVDGLGNLHTIGAGDDLRLSAARLSLGALGIITSVTLRTVPAYNLEMQIRAGRLDEMLALAPEYAGQNRHFEFYWIPYTNAVQVKKQNISAKSAQADTWLDLLNDRLLENSGVKLLSEISRRYPQTNPAVCAVMAKAITPNTRTQASHDIFGSDRHVKFMEMEYGLPAERLPAALRDLQALMKRRRYPISFPVEVRFTRADDILLSSAYGRDVAYIAIHAYQGVPCDDYFSEAEQLFLEHGGRPHWGKCHTLTAQDFSQIVPRYQDFLRVREEFDPQRRFANAYLNRVLGA